MKELQKTNCLRLIVTLVFFFGFFLQESPVGAAPAPDSEQAKRPKIGLVLGGGGARGAAHVGILKLIEKHRIPIDYIAGTSMGAIVGAAYASGMTADEIEETLLGIDWSNIFEDAPPRKQLSFRRKMDERRFTGAEFGFSEGEFQLPKGIISGRKLEFVLNKVFLSSALVRDFDNLKIPFRAVATDIENGDAVVLKSGHLAMAVRASMSIPGAFPPVELDNRNLVDGYVSNNVPVDVIKDMGADIIIAIDVGTPLSKSEDLNSIFDILGQVSSIAVIKNVRAQLELLKDKDILIRPELGNRSTTDFEKIREIIDIGITAAELSEESLAKLSVSEEEYQAFQDRHHRGPLAPIIIETVKITPTKRVSQRYIESKIRLTPVTPLDLEELAGDLTRIISIGEFERAGYSLFEEDDKTGLNYELKEKFWGPNYIRFGFNFYNNFDGDSDYNLILDHTRTWINDRGGEWRNTLQVGKTNGLSTEFYQPIDIKQRFFVSAMSAISQDIKDLYTNGNRIAEYRTRNFWAGGHAGINFGTAAEARAGLAWGTYDAGAITGDPDLPDTHGNRGQVQLRFVYDQIDDANFPKDGLLLSTSAGLEQTGLGGEASYEKIDIMAVHPITFMKRHTLILPWLNVGLNPDNDLPFYNNFTVGGFGSLAGYRLDELRGKQAAVGRAIYYYEVSRSLVSVARAFYLGASLEEGQVWDKFGDISFDDLMFGGSVFMAADTRFGPFYLSYGMSEGADGGEFVMSFGQRF